MAKKAKQKKIKGTGLPPGSMVFTGQKKTENITVHHLSYDQNSSSVSQTTASKFKLTAAPKNVNWYDVRGLHDTDLIEEIGGHFGVHPLVLEDMVDVHQRPKFEEYDTGIFVTVKALSFDEATHSLGFEHVAIFFNQEVLFSTQETDSDLFKAVRERIDLKKGKIRFKNTDYLAYALLDVLVDHYYTVIEQVEEVMEELEEQMLINQKMADKAKIHHLKKELLAARKSISPLREAINRFSKAETQYIQEANSIYLRDLYDHTIQVMDMIESQRDLLNGLQDLFLNEVSFKMNQVMQVLTLVSSIFIPLTFLAGIYGMNFEYMPELGWKYGYPTLVAVMAATTTLLILYFKRKRWF